jgi:hypothetical protein
MKPLWPKEGMLQQCMLGFLQTHTYHWQCLIQQRTGLSKLSGHHTTQLRIAPTNFTSHLVSSTSHHIISPRTTNSPHLCDFERDHLVVGKSPPEGLAHLNVPHCVLEADTRETVAGAVTRVGGLGLLSGFLGLGLVLVMDLGSGLL